MIKILFVCLGNVCRSPMAEAIFRQKVEKKGLAADIYVESAGTGHWHVGKPPHEGTAGILKDNQIDATGLKARLVEARDLETFDLIVTMDASNLGNIQRLRKANQQVEITRLLDYVEDADISDVPDPYITGNFQEVYEMVDEACNALLEEVQEQWL